MTCREPQEDLSALIDGELSPPERARVMAHVDACADCRKALHGLQRTSAIMRALPIVSAPQFVTEPAMRLVRERAQGHEPLASRLRRRLVELLQPRYAIGIAGLAAAVLVAVLVGHRSDPVQVAGHPPMTSGHLIVNGNPDNAAARIRELARRVGGEAPLQSVPCAATEVCLVATVPSAANQEFVKGLGEIGRWQVMQADSSSSAKIGFEVHISRESAR